ncbi:hypothetical protein K438DRAFT_1852826, partial [Mycena galopus ATCC 62051]
MPSPRAVIDGRYHRPDIRRNHAPFLLDSFFQFEVRVVLFDNCSEIRSYILSGAVMEPSALDALLPQWRETYPDHPLSQPVTSSGRLLTEVPHPAPAADEQQGKLHCEPKSRVHGSLSKQAVVVYDLRHGREAQTYGIGIKEVLRVEDGKHVLVLAGKVLHTLGWPLTHGGGWEYHMADGLVSIGLIVGLDYKNPYIEPYRDFQ